MFPDYWPADVILELTDPAYASRTHGNKGTYQDGCRGPLCQKNERDIKREAYRVRQEALGLKVRVRNNPVPRSDDALLGEIMEWHWRERETERASRKVSA